MCEKKNLFGAVKNKNILLLFYVPIIGIFGGACEFRPYVYVL